MRRLRSVFNLAVKRGWMLPGTSPIARLDFVDGQSKEVEVFPFDQVAKMLNHALENDLELLPYLVLGFFCGIRPAAELEKVEWGDIDLTDHVATIRPEVSKTNRRRFPELSENSIAWLEEYRHPGGRMEGRIVPFFYQLKVGKGPKEAFREFVGLAGLGHELESAKAPKNQSQPMKEPDGERTSVSSQVQPASVRRFWNWARLAKN
jgi:integrase